MIRNFFFLNLKFHLPLSMSRTWPKFSWCFKHLFSVLFFVNIKKKKFKTRQSEHLLMRMSCRQVLIRLATRGLLSRRTVSIPLQSILSCFSGLVQYNPAYLFLLINKYGKYTCQSEVNYKFHSVKVLFLTFRKSVKNKYACKLFPKELKNQNIQKILLLANIMKWQIN